MRRVLLVLACAAGGIAFLTAFSAADGAVPWIGVALCALMIVAGFVGGRWGPGPVARGVKARHLALGNLATLAVIALAGLMLAWRPTVGAGWPAAEFLLWMAAAVALSLPANLMGREEPRRARAESHPERPAGP